MSCCCMSAAITASSVHRSMVSSASGLIKCTCDCVLSVLTDWRLCSSDGQISNHIFFSEN